MNPDRWAVIERVFHEARQRTAAERSRYLEAACGDDADLRREVESLLAAPASGATWDLAFAGLTPGARIGQRFGSYHIQSLLGAGGMGEVYRAHDARLGRDVALKILPPIFTTDPERLARFEREARVLASLNHPNIATIHGLEEAGGTRALVMELVDGHTLAEKLDAASAAGTRTLRISEALHIARQIADALDAAHEKGIVHRDLKPANIKVTSNGTVKVLDFGLAKAGGGDDPSQDISHSPTVTVGGTRSGVILGTAAYMSPEQARGRVVDKRTDIWAFGCVLYEMLAGRTAFEGETVSDTIAKILEREPEWSRLPPAVPPNVRRLIQRCLEKDPRQRLRDIADVRGDLEDRSNERRAGRTAWRLSPRQLIAGAATLVVLAAAAYSIRSRITESGATTSAPPRLTFSQLTSMPGAEWFPSLSPDGKWVVYSAEASGNRDIYLQSITGQNAINLTPDSPADEDQPAFSPDGEHIAFRSSRDGGGIFIMGRTGEGVRRLTTDGFRPAWSPDGRSIAYVTENVDVYPQNGRGPSELKVINVDPERPGQSRTLDVVAVQASWSPHARRFAMLLRYANSQQADIATMPVDGGEVTPVTSDTAVDWNPVWSPDGRYLYFTSDRQGTMNLWRVPIDEASGKVLGPLEPVTTPSTFAAHPAMAADGHSIAFSSVLITTNVARLSLDPIAGTVIGTPTDVTTGSRPWANPDPSPDGQLVTFYSSQNPTGHVYVARADGSGGLRQLTGDAAQDRVPRWSPANDWIVFFSNRNAAEYRIWGIHPDGSGLRQFTEADGGVYPTWSPDGSRLAFSGYRVDPVPHRNEKGLETERNARPDVFVIDPNRPWREQTPEVLPPFGSPSDRFVVNSWSPDGERLAGQIGLGHDGIAIYSFKSQTYDRLTNVGEFPVWLPDSRRILFADGTGKSFRLVDSVTKEVRQVFSAGREVAGPPRLSRDGRTAYFSRRVTESDIWLAKFEDPKP